ncbi:MFS transporter [Danxiaibacter flavus]|uniref:MFS transporter n=1 Tax=Danxiaibacter flavus TaxID=3049108 RepID=A0ABV3ZHS2_9BACT|nr:MFS transporter [Chitinophagaceae bacterium DXS]
MSKRLPFLIQLLPVFFGFFIMGFADVVGISANYIKRDFSLSDTVTNTLPFMVFLWFAVFSIPTSMLMNKIGRKNTVLLSFVISAVSLILPLLSYSFPVILFAFCLLGIGNTVLQVSLNPLLAGMVDGSRLASSLTLGQFIKAIASFLGPIITAFAVSKWGNWKLIFPLFGSVTLLSAIWLFATSVKRESAPVATTTFNSCFRLLANKQILMLFLGILFLVGVDVGLNITLPKILMERCGVELAEAGLATSTYFAARTVGSLCGSFLLARISGRRFMIITMVLAIICTLALMFVSQIQVLHVLIFTIGLCIANVFSIIFAQALQREPEKTNEVSGLLIMGVAGGALLPFIAGYVADVVGGQNGAIAVLIAGILYMLVCGISMKEETQPELELKSSQ